MPLAPASAALTHPFAEPSLASACVTSSRHRICDGTRLIRGRSSVQPVFAGHGLSAATVAIDPGPFRLTREGMRGAVAEELREGLKRDLAIFEVTA